jgi:hypothetical protein
VDKVPTSYRIIRNTNISTKNDALLERIAGVYGSLDSALDRVQQLQASAQGDDEDLSSGPIWLYDEDASEQEILDDVHGDARLGSIEIVR